MQDIEIREERFSMLLTQIGMPEEEKQRLTGGRIQKLTVHQESKQWHFDFWLPVCMPSTTYRELRTRLDHAFSAIATIDVSLTIDEAYELKGEEFISYWSVMSEWMAKEVPGLASRLQSEPSFKEATMWITTANNAETELMNRKLKAFGDGLCKKLGFQSFSIAFQASETEEDFQKFVSARKEEDETKARKALEDKGKKEQQAGSDVKKGPLVIGYPIKEEPVQLQSIQEEERRIVTQGYIFDAETKELRSGRTLLTFKITDYTDSILVKMFSRDKEDVPQLQHVKKGMWVKVRGGVQDDTYVRDLVMIANDINEIQPLIERHDTYDEENTRVELHLHTPMSQMDAVSSIDELVKQAAAWGHPAIAVTDHAVAQSFPDAYAASKKYGVKMMYGLEANVVDDGVPIAYNPAPRVLKDDTFVVFDVETTGLSANYDKIIELAAVRVKDGGIVDRFEAFANPHHPLSATTIDLTGITDEMVANAPEIDQVIVDFKQWIKNDILVAHNASFDMGFLNAALKKAGEEKAGNPVIDTLELARFLFPTMKNHRLNTLCKKFDIDLTQHHRAIYDAEATGYLFWKLLKDANERDIVSHDQLNNYMGEGNAYQRSRPFHVTILAQTEKGLKNLFKLISISHLDYFYRVPRIPRSKLEAYREGLFIGSACDRGEVFEGMMQKPYEEVKDIASFYDYLEVQPPANYGHLLEKELVQDELKLREILKNIVALGAELELPVVATGNVHYLAPHDKLYRQILIHSQGGANPLNKQTLPDVHFRTTDEMMEAFSFLPTDVREQIVIHAPRALANCIEEIKPIKDDLYTPRIEGADDEVRSMSYDRARAIYGEQLPELVEARIEKELKSIIGHGFSVIYLISHKLVKKSLDDGYLVGSRGSVGSSFVATMTEITEVNPLPPHYVCPSCQQSEFFTDGSVGSGFDLVDKNCPSCDVAMLKDGHDIPFETFLGFKGDKVPDIDLNFSGEYQPRAHNYTKELFGDDNVFRAGTIGTVAEKTAYGYSKGFAGDFELQLRGAEIDRLVSGCTGVKRTTGQHPGGIIVVPDYMDIYDFTPVQFPADDRESAWKTTHFDFHSIHDNLLKLDILGHDDPTVIRMLQDLSGMDPKTIPTDDAEVMKIFSGTESLGVTADQIKCKTGTLGIPEFGTRFVRQMLEETKPTTFSELVQISGLSHGTDVWLNNANELIYNGTCELSDVIGCRDDIMVYLMHKGLEPSLAFKIMEFVRKGKGLQEEWIEAMKSYNVPDWYIDSCQKIKYMFPKAHAAAYVLMAVRIAYFKVHHPILFYAAYFTVRADDFEIDAMRKGSNAIQKRLDDIHAKGFDAAPKEKALYTVLEIALEMCERKFSFLPVDLYQSSATEFIVKGDQLLPPFNALPGLGTNAALSIVAAREHGEFLSKEDLQKRSKISKTVIEFLDQQGCLEGLPDQNQLSLF
ncbi:PolC-type DNA polymerase III [Aureibacillus halotolerans]|uniref:DNA polymerase III PolC-type n=1 Tax=Aureibacillus halotolerans TaxID=1508390 RepID=A0A4R6U2T9_9BACI|nr:PolC-type DNA polymerase III [Aureibacillus halotolerans]TDQ39682.1 DNA polymerase III catalytic subunit PolC type [Aureibacillus halotolerans]